MSMEHDRMHQLALEAGYLQSIYLYKLSSDVYICDAELRKYTELLIDDIFLKIKDVTAERGLIDNISLKQQIKKTYIRE